MECNIGARCIGIRAAEFSMGARCSGIPAIETPYPLICAVADETAKTHNITQPRRINFFEFIIEGVHKLNAAGTRELQPNNPQKVTQSLPSHAVLSGDQILGSARALRVMPVRLGPMNRNNLPFLFKRDNRPHAPNF